MTDAQPYQPPTTVLESTSLSEEKPSTYPWALTVVAIGWAVLLMLAILGTRNTFYEMLEEFESELPAITMIALSVGWLLIIAIHVTFLLIANGGLVLVRIVKPKAADTCRRIARPLNWVSVVFSLLFGIVYVVGLLSPLLQMINGLS